MTTAQRKRLAREARKLAMECVAGTAPALDDSWDMCACAVGVAVERFGGEARELALAHTWSDWQQLVFGGDADMMEALDIVADANDAVPRSERHAAVVFPLLALADALEAA